MAMAKKISRRLGYSVYWCTTHDGDDDWFVVAQSAAEAASFHELSEGYRNGAAAAERVAPLPTHLCGSRGWKDPFDHVWTRGACWPSGELLAECGAEVATRSVRFGDREFLGDTSGVKAMTCTDCGAARHEPVRLRVLDGGKSP